MEADLLFMAAVTAACGRPKDAERYTQTLAKHSTLQGALTAVFGLLVFFYEDGGDDHDDDTVIIGNDGIFEGANVYDGAVRVSLVPILLTLMG